MPSTIRQYVIAAVLTAALFCGAWLYGRRSRRATAASVETTWTVAASTATTTTAAALTDDEEWSAWGKPADIESAAISAKFAEIELVIARAIDGWLAGPLHTAWIYAEGLVNGAVRAACNANDWEHVPTTLGHRIYQEHEVEGWSWAITPEEWQVGIGSLHGLAHGVVVDIETGKEYGVATDLLLAWGLSVDHLAGTGLTLDDIANAFTGDLLGAARAFLRAYDRPLR